MKRVIAAVGTVAVVLVLLLVVGRRSCGGGDDAKRASSTNQASSTRRGSGVAAPERTIAVLPWLVQPNVKPRKVAGKVVFEGTPVEGATVRLAIDAGFGVFQQVAEVKTGSDGAFDFGPQPGARFNVSAEASGRTPAERTIAVNDPAARPDQLVLVLGACGSRLYGTVLDASGGAVGKAHLRAAGLAGAESNDSGEYSLCVPATNARVRVEADGYGTIEVFLQLFGELRYDFVLVPEAVLVGQVVTEDRRPVAGARVIAIPDPSEGPHHIASGWALAEDDGRFRIPGLSPGHYRVTADADGLASAVPVDAIVQAGTQPRDTIVVVAATARVSGHVMMAEQPVAGAGIVALRGGPMGPMGPPGFVPLGGSLVPSFSQEDGSFVLTGVPLGTVRFAARPYEVVAPKQLEIKTTKVDGVTLEVARLASIHGTITRKGQPVEGAQLQGPSVPEVVRSDATGAYRIEGLPPGEARFIAWSIEAKAFAQEKVVKLAAGEDKRLDIELDRAGEVKGVVVDESGKPVPGVYVRMFSDDGLGDLGESMTDASGRFDAGSMAGGTYIASVYPSPMAGQPFEPATGDRFEIEVPRDGIVENIKLAIKYETFSIAGTVVDDTGAPVADVHIEAIGRGKGGIDLPSIMSAADGSFAIRNLARGTYNLHAHGSDGSEGDAFDVASGSEGVVVKLVRPGAIEGTLVGFSTQPQVNMRTLTPDLFIGGNPIVEGTRFWQTGLRPGSYVIEAKVGNEVDGASVEIKSGQTAKVTLTSRGMGKLDGHLYEFGSKTPLPGYRCDANLSVNGEMGGAPSDNSQMSFPDDKGHFAMSAPVGKVRVFCFPQGNPSLTVAGSDIEVSAQGTASVEVYGVRVKFGASGGDAGFRIRPLTLPLVVDVVRPQSAAATQGMKIGDRVVTIDGLPVQGLLPQGASVLIANHKPGSIVTVGVDRAGTAVTFKLPVTASPD